MKTVTYKFDEKIDMIELAKYIQSSVYWGHNFTIKGEEDRVPSREIWDIIDSEVNEKGAIGISFNIESDELEFIYKEDK